MASAPPKAMLNLLTELSSLLKKHGASIEVSTDHCERGLIINGIEFYIDGKYNPDTEKFTDYSSAILSESMDSECISKYIDSNK